MFSITLASSRLQLLLRLECKFPLYVFMEGSTTEMLRGIQASIKLDSSCSAFRRWTQAGKLMFYKQMKNKWNIFKTNYFSPRTLGLSQNIVTFFNVPVKPRIDEVRMSSFCYSYTVSFRALNLKPHLWLFEGNRNQVIDYKQKKSAMYSYIFFFLMH